MSVRECMRIVLSNPSFNVIRRQADFALVVGPELVVPRFNSVLSDYHGIEILHRALEITVMQVLLFHRLFHTFHGLLFR